MIFLINNVSDMYFGLMYTATMACHQNYKSEIFLTFLENPPL